MDFTLFFAVFTILGIIYFAVGMGASKEVHTDDDYFLANRQFGLVSVTLTLIATQVGAGMLVGASEEAYAFGYYGILYNLGMCIGFLLLGLGAASKLREFNISTTAELFEKLYASKLLRKLASLLSIITLGGILAGQILASRKLLGSFYDNADIFMFGFWCMVIIYTMFGGLKAVVATDILQVIIIFLVFMLAMFWIIRPDDTTWLLSQQSLAQNFKTPDYSKFYSFLLMPILFSFIEQDIAQRFFSAKTKKIAALSAILSAFIIMAFSFVPVYLGMKAKMLGIEISNHSNPLLLLIKSQTNELILVFVVCALIAAISSTADSLLCAVGSNVVNDFTKKNKRNQSNSIFYSRLTTLIVGAVAMIAAYSFDNVLDILTQSYELSVSCLFIPIVACFIKDNLNAKSALWAFILGLAGFFLFRIWPDLSFGIPREVASLLLSLIAYLVCDLGTYYTKQNGRLA